MIILKKGVWKNNESKRQPILFLTDSWLNGVTSSRADRSSFYSPYSIFFSFYPVRSLTQIKTSSCNSYPTSHRRSDDQLKHQASVFIKIQMASSQLFNSGSRECWTFVNLRTTMCVPVIYMCVTCVNSAMHQPAFVTDDYFCVTSLVWSCFYSLAGSKSFLERISIWWNKKIFVL